MTFSLKRAGNKVYVHILYLYIETCAGFVCTYSINGVSTNKQNVRLTFYPQFEQHNNSKAHLNNTFDIEHAYIKQIIWYQSQRVFFECVYMMRSFMLCDLWSGKIQKLPDPVVTFLYYSGWDDFFCLELNATITNFFLVP